LLRILVVLVLEFRTFDYENEDDFSCGAEALR
jgi:hypothetical protein